MRTFLIITKYQLSNILKSKWIIFIMLFSMVLSLTLSNVLDNFEKFIISINSIFLIITPLISALFSGIYYYDNLKFYELLIGNFTNRKVIITSVVFTVTFSISISLLLPILIISIIYFGFNNYLLKFILLHFFLISYFSLISFIVVILNNDRLKGISISIIIYLFFSIFYDALILFILVFFSDYPIENLILYISSINPILTIRIYFLKSFGFMENIGYIYNLISNFFIISTILQIFICLVIFILIIFYFETKEFY